MNPLLQHPILQHLPYEALKNPTEDGIKKYLYKRVRSMKRLKYLFAILTVFQLFNILMFSGVKGIESRFPTFYSIIEVGMLILLPMLTIACHFQQKKSRMSDEEIHAVIQRHSASGA
jgi:hypothetical protein